MDNRRQVANLDLWIVCADVKDLSVAIREKNLEQTDDRVGDVAEGSGLSAVPVYWNTLASDRGDHEGWNDAPVVQPNSGTENIEGAGDLHGKVIDLGVVDAEGLAHPLWLVVAGAGADA